METLINDLVNRLERGGITRRQLIQNLAALVAVGGTTETVSAQAAGLHGTGIDHVSILVSDLQRSEAFYRDLFAVVDNDWFDLLWFKNLSIPDAALRAGVRQTVSQSFWQRLQTDEASVASS